jgi:hypothetical protein
VRAAVPGLDRTRPPAARPGLTRRGAGDTAAMDVATLARAQAVNRLWMGSGLILLPGLLGRVWVGSAAVDDRAKVLARSLGARDLALGAAGVLALRDGDRRWASRSFGAQAFADAVDLLAIVAGPRVPLGSRIVGDAMAAGSAAVAALYARRLATGDA